MALLELWDHLDPEERMSLLEQALSSPDVTREFLQRQLEEIRKGQAAKDDPYRTVGAYRPKEFWEVNTADYVKWEIYQPDEPEILTLVTKVNPSRVLELGCGAGRNTRYFSGAERYVGIDLAMNLLRRAVDRQEPNSRGLFCGDVTSLCFADDAFDLVFADSTLQHVPPDRIEQCIAELARVTSRFICLIEYTKELEPSGIWFQQVHMFAHEYTRLMAPYAVLRHRAETSLRVHPAKKEAFLFEKKRVGHG